MEKIVTQDVYLPVLERTMEALKWMWDKAHLPHTPDHFNVPANAIVELEELIEKHSNMVVLTREQAIKMVERAMWEQHCNGVDDSTWEETEEQRQFYLTQLFGEGK
jgi:hypothetical protein